MMTTAKIGGLLTLVTMVVCAAGCKKEGALDAGAPAQDAFTASDLATDLMTNFDLAVAHDSTVSCAWQDASIAPGQSVSDGCNTCSCSTNGLLMCTARACIALDASAPSCTLQAALSFGYDGGLVAYRDGYTLDSTAGMTITRSYVRGLRDGSGMSTCSPPLPACGAAGVVSLSTIVADLAATDVQAAFSQATTPLFGVDQRPVDGAVWSITLTGRGTVQVGGPCPTTTANGCVPIPAGVQRLADDLKSLASAMAGASVCAGL